MLRIFGTQTSPYVRRVRVLALELSIEHELVDITSEEGQASLRALNPLWKVPSAELDGRAMFDSRVICDHLVTRFGEDRIERVTQIPEHNTITVIDGALDSLINAFYLGRDGVSAEQSSYISKQQARARAAMDWLEPVVADNWQPREDIGLAEIALATTAAWMRFRATYPVDEHPAIVKVLEHCEARPSFVATQPPT